MEKLEQSMNIEVDLSVIIPVYNESKKIPTILPEICEYFLKEWNEKEVEILFVLEKSPDREITKNYINQYIKQYPSLFIHYLENDDRYGKGYTVKKGMLSSHGALILMSDTDFSTPITELKKLTNKLSEEQCDAVIGKRIQIVKQPFYRKIMGWGFRKLSKAILKLPFYDTQCGFKLFTRNFVENVFPSVSIRGFGFDIEVLSYGLSEGFAIEEIEVLWYNDAESTVSPVKDSIKMFKNLFKVKNKINEKRSYNGNN